MKPLPRENTIWEFPRAHIFVIFSTFFTASSRIHILSIFHRILSVWGLHFGTLGTTFGGHFLKSKKYQIIRLHCAPEGRPSATPPGEGGNHRRFSPLTLPTSKKGSYNIWPSVENLEKHNFFMTFGIHFGTFFSQVRPQECLGEPLGAPWEHLCLQTLKNLQKIIFLDFILGGILNTCFMFFNVFFK